MVCENGESKQEKKVKNDITSKGYVFAIKYGCQYSSPRVYIKYEAKILGWQTSNMYENFIKLWMNGDCDWEFDFSGSWTSCVVTASSVT